MKTVCLGALRPLDWLAAADFAGSGASSPVGGDPARGRTDMFHEENERTKTIQALRNIGKSIYKMPNLCCIANKSFGSMQVR